MTALEVESVSLFAGENSRRHHTDKFEMVHEEVPTPVLRRGEPFKLSLTFKGRGFNSSFDKVRILFNYGDMNESSRGHRGGAWVTNAKELSENAEMWGLRLTGQNDRTIFLEMRCSILAAVGVYYLSVKTSVRSSGDIITYQNPQPVYILMNPWHKEDTVYMPKQRLLDEYILNDIGKIWYGNFKHMINSRGREWIFGQFDSVVLKAVAKILDNSNLRYEHKGNPVFLSRVLSKLINSADEDNGVLEGNWSGNYDDGVAPNMWTGSVPILKEYLENGIVKYGQCWVFSGVLTTVCRAIGMPARSVSNIVSAHDGDASLTFDTYFSEDNEIEDSDDSIWNFHVWNDVWMARPDLPSGYGGWQAIDATPQETSDGVFQCGPASLEAVKQGDVGLKYDVPFLIASVNADYIKWRADPNSLLGYVKMNTNNYHVGRIILSKQPFIFDPHGDADREDVTHFYKNPEGSGDERLSYYKAVKNSELASVIMDMPDPSDEDVTFDIKEIDSVNIGETFALILTMENTANEIRTVQCSLSATSVYYNGVKANLVKKQAGKVTLRPKLKETIRLSISPDDYLDKLVEYAFLKMHAVATVMETKQTWAGEDDFQFIKPNLTIVINKNMDLGMSNKITFKFKNPLTRKLTNCKLVFEANGVLKHTRTPYRDIRPEEDVEIEHRFTPITAGEYTIVGIIYSKELHDITGSEKFSVV